MKVILLQVKATTSFLKENEPSLTEIKHPQMNVEGRKEGASPKGPNQASSVKLNVKSKYFLSSKVVIGNLKTKEGG